MIKYDDVGSLPLPDDVEREGFERAFVDFEKWALDVYRRLMELKVDAGVQVPCYPQIRNMNDQFLEILNDSDLVEEPYLVREDEAVLPELEAFEIMDMGISEIKICITGPLELAASISGGKVYDDVLLNIARSLNRFVRNAESLDKVGIEIVSVDEPSLGVNPNLRYDEDALIEAWNIVGDTDKDVQVHLHSPLPVETACRSQGLEVIDIGIGSEPEYVDDVDLETLESYGKGLRFGVSRTDVLSLSSEFNEKHGVNVWTDEDSWNEFIRRVEPPSKILKRIKKVYEKFGDLIEFLGPDCGLGGAKRLELADKILRNTNEGIQRFLSSD